MTDPRKGLTRREAALGPFAAAAAPAWAQEWCETHDLIGKAIAR